jgi:PAS domain S-box-containing protein
VAESEVATGTEAGDLLFRKSLLEAQTEASTDGILVVSPEGRILSFNRRFAELWELPGDVLATGSDEAAIASVRDKLVDPDAFLARIAYLYEHPDEESHDVLALVDGRVIERHSAPVKDEQGVLYGRVWFFRDTTERVRAEEELQRRVDELATVYGMADAVVHADTLDRVLEDALDALTEALGTARASVLLADDEGVMRFRAWRGLSDEYRAAADGYSPWPPDEKDPRPVLVPDVEDDEELAAFREAILAEGIRALAFVPLVHQRTLLGKFMVYRANPHGFDEREVRLAQAIASHVAAAADRARAQQQLRESRDQLEVILRSAADGITVQDPAGRLLFANDAAARIIGFATAADLLATPVGEVMGRFELLDAGRRPLPFERLPGRRALAGEEKPEELILYRIRDTGEERWSLVRATAVHGPDGTVQFAVNAFQDVTNARRAEERSRFLARAGEILSSSLDYEATLRSVAELAVPQLGDWCIVYMQEEDGSIRRLALEHAGGLAARAEAALARHPLLPDAADGVPAVIRSGASSLVEQIDAQSLARDVEDPEGLLDELSFLPMRSYMCVPLRARGRTFGAISLLSGESGRVFGPDDLELAEELARRAAVAVDNARLYGEAQAAARGMEESLALLEAVLASAPVGIGFWDTELRYVRVNEALAEINGLPRDEHPGKTLAEVVPGLAAQLEPLYRRVLETGEPYMHVEATGEVASTPGDVRHWLTSYYPVRTASGEVIGLGAVVLEITDRRRAEDERSRRVRQQAVVAELGQVALSGADLDRLLQDAVARLAATLDVEYAKVLELLPDGGRLLLRAGVGWHDGLVGSATVVAGLDSQAGFTLQAKEPVVVEDLAAETRFSGPPLLREHDVISGMSVVIGERERPFGVLGVHTASPRAFTAEDVNYLQAVANVLAAAVERKRAEDEQARLYQAAQYQSELTRTIADNAASALFMMDARGHTTYMNPAAEAMTGYTLGEIGDAPLHDAVHHTRPDGTPYPVEECPIDRALPTKKTLRPYEDVFVRKDGSFFPVLASASPIVSDGEPVGTVIEVREITEEKRAERERADLLTRERAARREAEARAQAAQALHFVGDGVFLVDSAGVVRLWNPAAETITGLRADAVEGRGVEQAIPGWAQLARRVPVTGADADTPARPQTLPLELGGQEVWLSISGVDFGGGTVFAFRDMTDERRVEKLKSDFVSTVSHELRTPLAAIYGAALTLRRPDLGGDPERQESLLEVVAGESQRLARIVNDILWTSRIESGGLEVRIEPCDGGALAESVVQAALLHVPADVRLELVLADDLPPVAADPDKVRQVLANLLENGIKYSPDGGVVELRVEPSETRVRFAVRDEGLGVPAVEQERIFEKFYRLDPDLTRGVGGTGLGLYICRELVERMGGRIWVESDGERGSTFVVELPGEHDVAAHLLVGRRRG